MNYLLSFRERKVGGRVTPGFLESGLRYAQVPNAPPFGTLDDLATETRLLCLIHGYNWDGEKGEYNLVTLAQNLQLDPGWGIVCVLWPGDHWTGPASYSFEGDDADESGMQLAEFLNDHSPLAQLHVVTHSLGARVAMEALLHLTERLGWAADRLGQVCLTAAAIDDYSLGYPKAYLDTVPRTDRVAVLASRRDKALLVAYPAGELLQNFVFFWRESYGLALGYHGPKEVPRRGAYTPANVRGEQIDRNEDVGHGDYMSYLDADAGRLQKCARATGFIRRSLLQTSTDPVY